MGDQLNQTNAADAPDSSEDFTAALADEAVRGRYGEPWERLGPLADSGEADGQVLDAGADENGSGSGGIVGHFHNVAEPFADHIVSPVAGAIGTIIDVASAAWALRESLIGRRLQRQAREPLVNLYEAYPEAKLASPRELGLRFVPVEEILGTAAATSCHSGRSAGRTGRGVGSAYETPTSVCNRYRRSISSSLAASTGSLMVTTASPPPSTPTAWASTLWSPNWYRSTARPASGRRTCSPTLARPASCELLHRAAGRRWECAKRNRRPSKLP